MACSPQTQEKPYLSQQTLNQSEDQRLAAFEDAFNDPLTKSHLFVHNKLKQLHDNRSTFFKGVAMRLFTYLFLFIFKITKKMMIIYQHYSLASLNHELVLINFCNKAEFKFAVPTTYYYKHNTNTTT